MLEMILIHVSKSGPWYHNTLVCEEDFRYVDVQFGSIYRPWYPQRVKNKDSSGMHFATYIYFSRREIFE